MKRDTEGTTEAVAITERALAEAAAKERTGARSENLMLEPSVPNTHVPEQGYL